MDYGKTYNVAKKTEVENRRH